MQFLFFFFLNDGVISSSPSTHLLTWSLSDLRLQPKDPKLWHVHFGQLILPCWHPAVYFLHVKCVCPSEFERNFSFIHSSLIHNTPSPVRVLFETLAAFHKDGASHVGTVACPNTSGFHGYTDLYCFAQLLLRVQSVHLIWKSALFS